VHLEEGVLLQHIGFSSRTNIKARFAEVVFAEVVFADSSEVQVLVSGDVGARSLKRFDLLRWWNELPLVGDIPPTWVKKGAVFRARDKKVLNRAVVQSAHPGWVSFYDRLEGYPEVFRIVEYGLFKDHWEPDRAPTAWDWILEDV